MNTRYNSMQVAPLRTGTDIKTTPIVNENEIVKTYDPQIRALAARFTRWSDRRSERKDVEQVGRMALIKASRRWVADRAKLWTFARPSVIGAMLTHVTKRIAIEHEEISNSAFEDFEDSDGESFGECVGEFVGTTPADQDVCAEFSGLLSHLSEDQKNVIRLSLEGKRLVEMAKELGSDKTTVWEIYQNAVCKMRDVLSGDM